MNTIALENRFTSGVYGKREVAIVRGQGTTVWDDTGRAYLDCTAGIGVANIGHAHPRLAAAICSQAQALITCQEMFYNDQRAALLARLEAIVPNGLNRVFLSNSGAEAIEAAIKFARISSGRAEIVATTRGFHGRTLGALSATHKAQYRQPFMPLVPGFKHVAFGQIEAMQEEIGENTAAVLIEVIQGEGGIHIGSKSYFAALKSLCHQRGALLIVDEIQSGFGRTGHWFASNAIELTPDILCLGKAVAGGIPMGVTAFGKRVAELPVGVHGSTFGGNPLACAAALATLDILEEESLISRAADSGAYFLSRLRALTSPLVREVRGMGLMIGVDLRIRAMPVVRALMEQGILALTSGTTVIRLLPPLTISRGEMDLVVGALQDTLAAMEVHQAAQAGEA